MFPLQKHSKSDANKLVYYYTEVHAMVVYGFKLYARILRSDDFRYIYHPDSITPLEDRLKYVWFRGKKLLSGDIVIISNPDLLAECFDRVHKGELRFDPKYLHIKSRCFNGGELNLHIEEYSWSNGSHPLGPLDPKKVPDLLLSKEKISLDMKNRLEYWCEHKK